MTPDLAPIEAFIASHHPVSELPAESITELAHSVQILYRTTGNNSDLLDPDKPRLYLIRKGAIDLKSSDGKLIDRLGPGASFGFPYLLTGEVSGNQIVGTEDMLVYAVPASTFHTLRHRHPAFERYFTQALAARFRLRSDNSAYRAVQRISDVMTSRLVAIEASASIRDAAILMTDSRVSSVLVTEDERLVGIVTDRDLRARVLAVSADAAQPISTIMTSKPVSANQTMFVHEAGLLMLQHNIHHLPVLDGERPVGVMSASDLLRVRNTDPLYLVSKIAKSESVEALSAHASQTQRLLFELIRADLTAENIGQIFTGINDAPTKRLIHLAQQQLDQVLVFHHACLDLRFLAAATEHTAQPAFQMPFIDTLKLEQCHGPVPADEWRKAPAPVSLYRTASATVDWRFTTIPSPADGPDRMIVDFSELNSASVYHWMTQSIIPRPIAWVLSVNDEASADPYNLAPFSYFTAVSSNPPTVIFSAGRKSAEAFKDSYVNVSERRSCVINIASVAQMAAVTETSRTLPYGESELTRAEIELTDFEGFHLPRIKGSPIAFACEHLQTIEVGPGPQMLLLCEVKRMFADDSVMTADAKGRPLIDTLKVDPLCRLGGGQYASLAQVFTLPRPQ